MAGNANAKSELVHFLQRYIGRTLTKEDVVYTTTQSGEFFQSTVRLACNHGEEFAGDLCATDKEAMQAAAAQAIGHFSAEIAALPPKEPKKKQSKAKEGAPQPGAAAVVKTPAVPQEQATNDNPKSELARFLQRYIGRTLTKEDVVYTTSQSGEFFQSTVRLVCNHGEEFVGDLCATDKEAMQAAAAQAIGHFSAEIAALPPKEPKKKQSKAKEGAPQPGAAAVVKPPAVPQDQAANFKSELVMKLQQHCKRAMTKADVTYEVAKTPPGSVIGDEGFQATVTLHCVGGQEFTGDVTTSDKLAQQSAAQQAVLHFHMWLPGSAAPPAVPVTVPAKNAKNAAKTVKPAVVPVLPVVAAMTAKRKAAAPPAPAAPLGHQNPKSELVILMQSFLKRAMTKSDIVFTSGQTVGGIQATVQLICYQNREFAGEVCENQKLAEASAAFQALHAISAEIGQPVVPTPAKKQKVAAGVAAAGVQRPAVQRVQPVRVGGKVVPAPSFGVAFAAGKPKGQPGFGAAAAPVKPKGQGKANGAVSEQRALVTEDYVTGEVVKWNETGGFGWLQPHIAIEHPAATERQGKIYVHKKDVGPTNPISAGCTVQFRLYSDSKGLGACEVEVL